ncbi:M20/M25/M40 family metallo-hydrolase [Orrella marina]|nr:M20/M25/M40 family metallo-hydrolase [Orrella marina]
MTQHSGLSHQQTMNQQINTAVASSSESTPKEVLIDAWVAQHFEEEVALLQKLVQTPTDTPPGDNAPHAEVTARYLESLGWTVERFAVPAADVQAAGMQSITNLIVRRDYGSGGPTIALNAHGDVVPPGDGWTHDPYGGKIENGFLYGRASAVSKSDFASYIFAIRALEACARPTKGCVELHLTYDEEFGGELGPGWLLRHGHTHADMMMAAGFSYEVVTAHNGCLQMEVSVCGKMAHAAIPDTGVDALQGAVHILQALYARNKDYKSVFSGVPGITHPYLNVGRIEGGTNTNVVPGTVSFKLDRRMIPEENPSEVEAEIREVISKAVQTFNDQNYPGQDGVQVSIRRLLLAHAMRPLPASQPLVTAIQKHAQSVLGEAIPAVGTPLYTDVRLYAQHGIPGVIYGAGPRTVLESNAKRPDERIALADLKAATCIVARTLADLLSDPGSEPLSSQTAQA